jgi:hypothetical protein
MGTVTDAGSAELNAALRRAELAESKVQALSDELARVREWRRALLIAVVAVALLAILMLGLVAFNATDDAQSLAGVLTHA